jgi:methylated-DNA-[protein]-cysteine S-methyltransferase
MDAYFETMESPLGPIRFAVDAEGALLGLKFLDGPYPLSLDEELRREGHLPAHGPERTAAARLQLEEFFALRRRRFALPLALRGTEFQKAVWRALLDIPFGQTRSYAQLAQAVGRPGAARAVGRANATNRIALVIPCHRVIGADGSLGGFSGGVHLKERLLEFEGTAPTAGKSAGA